MHTLIGVSPWGLEGKQCMCFLSPLNLCRLTCLVATATVEQATVCARAEAAHSQFMQPCQCFIQGGGGGGGGGGGIKIIAWQSEGEG